MVDSVVNESLMPEINTVYFQLVKFLYGDYKVIAVRYRTRRCSVLKIKKATLEGAALLLRG
ncbi:MAG: hypothetical protein ACJAVX_000738 [Pseudoalteromonas rhizosphaerae]